MAAFRSAEHCSAGAPVSDPAPCGEWTVKEMLGWAEPAMQCAFSAVYRFVSVAGRIRGGMPS